MCQAENVDRYAGKPFLRILECYVLNCIGRLDPQDDRQLRAIEPKLRNVYKIEGDWTSIVRGVMGFQPAVDDFIKDSWIRNLQTAERNGDRLTAQRYAEMICDENFAES
jgi:hypothetical protein